MTSEKKRKGEYVEERERSWEEKKKRERSTN